MTSGERIKKTFYGIALEIREEVLWARERLDGIPGKEVIEWFSEEAKNYNCYEFLYGVKNLEKIFEAKFSLEVLVNVFFTEKDAWTFYSNEDILYEFNKVTGRDITADDVARVIDIGFVRKSASFGVGVIRFAKFIDENGGNVKAFIRRIAPYINVLTTDEIRTLCYYQYQCK